MEGWLKTLTGTLCILTVLTHLLPGGKFSGYVKFYVGILFFLVAVRPAMNLLFGDGELERLLQLEFTKGAYTDMEGTVEGMAELKNAQIIAACQEEVKRQIQEIVMACYLQPETISVTFSRENEYVPERVTIASEKEADTSQKQTVQQEIADLYGIPTENIQIK